MVSGRSDSPRGRATSAAHALRPPCLASTRAQSPHVSRLCLTPIDALLAGRLRADRMCRAACRPRPAIAPFISLPNRNTAGGLTPSAWSGLSTHGEHYAQTADTLDYFSRGSGSRTIHKRRRRRRWRKRYTRYVRRMSPVCCRSTLPCTLSSPSSATPRLRCLYDASLAGVPERSCV